LRTFLNIRTTPPVTLTIPTTHSSMVYITRIERFNAAHKLWVEGWTEEQNREVFGKCANKNWHGHNYSLHVTIKGRPDPLTGFIMDVKKLSELIRTEITEHLDHSNLNLDVPFIPTGLQPTTENLVLLIWQRMEAALVGQTCQLHAIKLWETETIYAEYYGEK
jgi:6-pyruvoyltetrahydropterin/6-carboxytetrahydropterin synthase